MVRRSKKRMAQNYLIQHTRDFEEDPPKVGHWVTQAIGSDRYSYEIEWVSEDKKKVRTVIGSEYWLNKWYIWLPEGWGKNTIMMDNGWLYISDRDISYLDPHF